MLSATGRYLRLDYVQNERIATCQLLSEIDSEKSAKYVSEIKNITKDQLIAQGIRTVDESKIYVNIDGIKESLKNIREEYDRLKELIQMSFYNEILRQLELAKQKKSRFIMLLSGMDECTNVLRRLFVTIRDEFVASNKHGLDGYLGVGIRHGALLNKLRTPFQDASLITKIDKDTGVYKEATYWRDCLKNVPEHKTRSLIDRLKKFSLDVDTIIYYIQDTLFKVKTENQNPDGLFDFDINQVKLSLLLTEINDKCTYEDFLDKVFSILWLITKNDLDSIRQHLNTNIKSEFAALFTDLNKDVYEILGKENSNIIDASIVNLRIRIMNELDAVANWFQLSQAASHPPYEISLPLEIGVAIAKNLSVKETMKVTITKTDNIIMKGETLKFIVEIVNILLDNVVKYNGFEDGAIPDVNIHLKVNGKIIHLTVENTLSKAAITQDKIDHIHKKQVELLQPVRLEAVTGTGGTGFEKIKKMIKYDLLTTGALDISLTDNKFIFSMQLNSEGITHENTNC